MTMSEPLPDWPRPYYQAGGGRPFLCFVVFGGRSELVLSRSRHRCAGVPEHLETSNYHAAEHRNVLNTFRSGYAWDQLCMQDPALAAMVEIQEHCTAVRGECIGDADLNYFRDAIGMVTALLDQGGVAVFDPQTFTWWSAEDWRARIFAPAAPEPSHQVVILCSEQDDGRRWYHTRGLRKYGRPDLSLRDVPGEHEDAVIDLFNRFIQYQALGAIIDEQREIRLQSLPSGMRCTHGGDLDDPDFNNVHVEIHWPPAIGAAATQ